MGYSSRLVTVLTTGRRRLHIPHTARALADLRAKRLNELLASRSTDDDFRCRKVPKRLRVAAVNGELREDLEHLVFQAGRVLSDALRFVPANGILQRLSQSFIARTDAGAGHFE
jgi:hypothetical protein